MMHSTPIVRNAFCVLALSRLQQSKFLAKLTGALGKMTCRRTNISVQAVAMILSALKALWPSPINFVRNAIKRKLCVKSQAVAAFSLRALVFTSRTIERASRLRRSTPSQAKETNQAKETIQTKGQKPEKAKVLSLTKKAAPPKIKPRQQNQKQSQNPIAPRRPRKSRSPSLRQNLARHNSGCWLLAVGCWIPFFESTISLAQH